MDHQREWYCVKTQTKREHIAAGHLRDLGSVEVFCPRIRYRKATRRGKVWWTEPLFPGYVLSKFDLATKERAVSFCQGVRGLVRFGSQFPPVPEQFVRELRNEVQQHTGPDEETISVSPDLNIGDEVEIALGPFQGMGGTVISIAPAKERVRILLDFLGETQAVDLDLFSILLPRRPTP